MLKQNQPLSKPKVSSISDVARSTCFRFIDILVKGGLVKPLEAVKYPHRQDYVYELKRDGVIAGVVLDLARAQLLLDCSGHCLR